MHRPNSAYRTVEVIKRSFSNDRCQLPGHSVPGIAFVDHNATRGLLHRVDQRLFIQRPECTRIYHLRLDTNLGGTFLCSKHALPSLKKSNGAIVNISSSRAHQSEPDSEAYAAAKGGLVAFTHALAISSGPDVRANSISPGWITTDAWQAPARRRTPKLSRRDHAQHAVGRVGQPEDIGALAVFLLSDLSGFITGQDHIVDGGMSRTMIYAE